MKHQSHRIRRSVAALAVTLAGGASALGLASAAQAATTTSATSYTFTTLDNQADPTFNQLLGINSHNVIAGYFGIGADGAPEQGLPAGPALRAGQLRQRELPRLGADPGRPGSTTRATPPGSGSTRSGTNRGFVEWNGVFDVVHRPEHART